MSLRRSALRAIYEHDQNTCRVRDLLAKLPGDRITDLTAFLLAQPRNVVHDLALWAIYELYTKPLAEKDQNHDHKIPDPI